MKKLYSAPRRYDLATLFAVLVGSAVLFAVLQRLGFSAAAFAWTAGLFAVVGLAQALLFGGQSPRAASAAAGGAYCALSWLIRYPSEIGAEFVFAVGIGASYGYLVGILVGGIFLCADLLRIAVTHIRFQARKRLR
jgi:hypothetical protein